MPKKPYSDTDKENLILRDHLAIDRTALANERTFLAYIRTALALFVSGATFVKFFDVLILEITGWIFIPLGIVVFIIGIIRYRQVANPVKKLKPEKHGN